MSVFSTRWRPKRASDRLLQPEVASEHLSPPQKKKELSGELFTGRERTVLHFIDQSD